MKWFKICTYYFNWRDRGFTFMNPVIEQVSSIGGGLFQRWFKMLRCNLADHLFFWMKTASLTEVYTLLIHGIEIFCDCQQIFVQGSLSCRCFIRRVLTRFDSLPFFSLTITISNIAIQEGSCQATPGTYRRRTQLVERCLQERYRIPTSIVARRYQHRTKGRWQQDGNHQGLQGQDRSRTRRNL